MLRTWDNYEYTEKRLAWLRALIAEASLQRAGAYQVFLLVNVKNPEIRLEEDVAAYEQALREFVPEEFRDMAILFNERTLEAWYPLVQEHGLVEPDFLPYYRVLGTPSPPLTRLTHLPNP